jgi:type III pantothenate kinase
LTRCLQFDVGNSSAKWRLVAGGQVVARGRYRIGEQESLAALRTGAPEVDAIWVSSVAGSDSEQALSQLCVNTWQVAPQFARTTVETAGLRNSYADPSRMGVDRWLAMLGARRRDPGRVCVVDAGSALTIDLVAADGSHEGGYIIPGPALMERALLLDTDRVRFAEDVDYSLVPGTSTAEAVRHGIALAQAGAVAMVLQRCAQDPPQLYCCGGAGEQLLALLGCEGSFVGDLVFEGLEAMAATTPGLQPL